MKILIACDKFRGSLEGREVADCLKKGIESVSDTTEITIKEIADGGEGSLDLLSKIYACEPVAITVDDALGRPIRSTFGYNAATKVAVLEMASYVGLAMLSDRERDPSVTSSKGLGQAMNEAIHAGAQHLIIGVGGSASNDGGAGMLEALGFQFLDKNRSIVHPSGGSLHTIDSIEKPQQSIPKSVKINIATDVQNPLCGPAGATYTYAQQKGASEADLLLLEEGMSHFAALVQAISGNDVITKEGYGAAGGVPLAACELLGASITSGSQLIFKETGLSELIQDADLVITGEGKIDHQTLQGKAISPIVEKAVAAKKGLILVCGLYDQTSLELDRHPRFELSSLAVELNLDSFEDAAKLCVEVGRRIGRLEKAG